ncbi:uncharacterized protein LOC132558559 [Ylistrum balloti]|uniref:uncharacterized protein LOC132558559 n=1 Tax=Ylistrum balloti TaxID=509963 RepID=UPI0029059D95|nr:uncharacterized protein LOC132558559 [Ylistrum balloti]
MESVCGKLLTSTIILPFAGPQYRRRQHGSWYYDCVISSRVLVMIFVSLVFGFTVTKSIPKHAEFRLGFVLSLLLVIMISALSIFCIIGTKVRKYGLQSVVAARNDRNTRKLQVVFMWIFGLSSGLSCALFIGKLIECSVNFAGGIYWNILLVFNITLILALFSEMVFVSYFSPFELKQSSLVNYAMFLILTCNLSVILYVYQMKNTRSFLIEVEDDIDLISCLGNNSTMTLLLEKSLPFLRPAFVEYVFLSSTILLEIWSPKQEANPQDESPTYIGINDVQESEQTSLLHGFNVIEHPANRGRRTLVQILSLAMSITTGLGLVVCYIVLVLDIGDGNVILYIAQVYELTLKVMMALATFAGFYCLAHYCTPDSSPKGLKSREYLYLLSAFGLFLGHISIAIGADVTDDQNTKIILFTNAFSVFQDYLQVVFLLHANRFRKTDPRSNINLLESVLIFTMINNFIFWFTDSFFISEFSRTQLLHHSNFPQYLLNLVYSIFLPFSVFFRFTTFLEYYAIFGKFNSQEH